MEFIDLPENLYSAIGSESSDFAVRARSVKPLRKSVFSLIFGIAWLTFTSVFIFSLLGAENPFETGAAPVQGETNPVWFLVIFFGVFLLVGVIILASAIVPALRSGGYFVGTPKRLIHFRNNRLRSVDWEQFTGDIEVRGSEMKGTISLKLRTGRIVHRSKGGSQYVPDMIYMANIPDAYKIERLIRKRISENDPVPARL